ncbi:helix-turn-helix domain-containing protein [Geodermatophilus pulveris]|uniref:helix-turn-helix domain-containing protein n=1 Tax=Geodermatophilus pulveris TaxID=1564159 RepID=UPI0015C69153
MVLVQRIASGRPPAHVAAEMGVSRACAYKWWGRWRAEGKAGLVDPVQPCPPPSQAHPGVHRDPDPNFPAPVPLRTGRDRGAREYAGFDGRASAAPTPGPAAGCL